LVVLQKGIIPNPPTLHDRLYIALEKHAVLIALDMQCLPGDEAQI
jgi:hypothetical protein